jgi:hypothetical protein
MTTRRITIIGAFVMAGLTLSACGASVKQTITSALHSIGSQQYVQMHLTASVSGTGAASTYESVLSKLSYDVSEQSTTGGPIDQSNGHVNSDIVVNVSGTPLLHLVQINDTLYVKIDFSTLTAFSQLSSTLSAEIPTAQLTFGDRWFEIPRSLLTSYLPTTQSDAQTPAETAAESKIIDAITAVIEKNPYSATSNGFEQTGTLDTLTAGVAPTIAALEHQTPSTVGHTPGTYHVALGLNGATATSASLGITAQGMTVALNATVSHDAIPISAPTGATIITPALIQSLGGSGL